MMAYSTPVQYGSTSITVMNQDLRTAYQDTSGLVLKDSTLRGEPVHKHSTCEVPCSLYHYGAATSELVGAASRVAALVLLQSLNDPTFKGSFRPNLFT
jgi:hypothetical protein